jgi:hypothetical protein
MERSNQIFEKLIPDPKSPSLDDYYKKFKSSFHRIWTNKFLWFWGMFLPGSLGVGFNIDEQLAKFDSKELENWQNFVLENLEILSFLFAMLLVFWLGIWCISAIARSGVIQTLSCLHNPKNRKKLNCKLVWGRGKKHFRNILLLDVFVAMAMLIVFLVLLIPVAIMILVDNQAGAIFLFITLLFFFFFFMIFMNYLLQVSIIYVVLANMEILGALKLGTRLIMRNLPEVLKLFAILFLISVIQGTVFLIFIAFIFPFWDKATGSWFSFFINPSLEWILTSFVAIVMLTIFSLLIKAIFSLWIQDLWVWWVEEIGGNKNEPEEEVLAYEKEVETAEAMVGGEI